MKYMCDVKKKKCKHFEHSMLISYGIFSFGTYDENKKIRDTR